MSIHSLPSSTIMDSTVRAAALITAVDASVESAKTTTDQLALIATLTNMLGVPPVPINTALMQFPAMFQKYIGLLKVRMDEVSCGLIIPSKSTSTTDAIFTICREFLQMISTGAGSSGVKRTMQSVVVNRPPPPSVPPPAKKRKYSCAPMPKHIDEPVSPHRAWHIYRSLMHTATIKWVKAVDETLVNYNPYKFYHKVSCHVAKICKPIFWGKFMAFKDSDRTLRTFRNIFIGLQIDTSVLQPLAEVETTKKFYEVMAPHGDKWPTRDMIWRIFDGYMIAKKIVVDEDRDDRDDRSEVCDAPPMKRALSMFYAPDDE